ncbi:MAG: response regulator transcription factor [Bacteroidetes bacterium]|nr:response regulator transcription factor [Bacteroidota bacterium]MCW5894658.1 response regulator transcription factor [Bacteroidota bacterium]
MKRRILLLEDDVNLAFMLQEHLEAHGFAVIRKANGDEGLAEFSAERFDLCLVDVMMPKRDGFTFVRELRMKDEETPVIFLTAKAMKEDRVQGFKAGGDDYVTKPFSMEELLLRIEAVLKRTGKPLRGASGPIPIGRYSFDANKQLLLLGKKKTKLTSTESLLLQILYQHRNATVERSTILNTIWGSDTYFNGRSLDVFISKLRKYLTGDPSLEIKNTHGKGYKLITAE